MTTTHNPRPTPPTAPRDTPPPPPAGRARGVRIPLTAVVGALAFTALATAVLTTTITTAITTGADHSAHAAVSPGGYTTTTAATPVSDARSDPDTGETVSPEATAEHPAEHPGDASAGGFDRLFAQTETDADTARAQQNAEIQDQIRTQAAHPDPADQH